MAVVSNKNAYKNDVKLELQDLAKGAKTCLKMTTS